MKTNTAKTVSLLMAMCFLGSCNRGQEAAPTHVVVPRMAVFIAQQFLLGEPIIVPEARPGALLGIHTTLFLSRASLVEVEAPRAGIEAQLALRDFGGSGEEKYTLLQDLSSALSVDLQQMLNGSEDREAALDTYIESLNGLLEASASQLIALDQELDEVQDERRAKRSALSDLQRTLRNALRDEDYATAGSLQEQVVAAQTDLATVDAEEDELRSNIRIYEDLIEIGATRSEAIAANREVLISGQTVIDVPGIEDIGIIKDADEVERNSEEEPLGEL